MKFEAIPILELSVPDGVTLPKLSADDVYRLLATKVLRGRFFGAVLFVLSLGGLVCSLTIFPSAPWAIASALGGALFGFVFYRSRQKLDLARRISNEPQLVYWAHPTLLRQTQGGQTIDSTFITLHSRSGASFEVAVSRDQLLAIVVWLREHNPNIRLGPYDDTAPNPK